MYFINRSKKVRACSCGKEWCSDLRKRHRLLYSLVRFPTDDKKRKDWCNDLGVNDNIIKSKTDPRIWVGHFPESQIRTTTTSASSHAPGPGGIQPIELGSVKFDGLIKHARPNAKRIDIVHSWLYQLPAAATRTERVAVSPLPHPTRRRRLKDTDSILSLSPKPQFGII